MFSKIIIQLSDPAVNIFGHLFIFSLSLSLSALSFCPHKFCVSEVRSQELNRARTWVPSHGIPGASWTLQWITSTSNKLKVKDFLSVCLVTSKFTRWLERVLRPLGLVLRQDLQTECKSTTDPCLLPNYPPVVASGGNKGKGDHSPCIGHVILRKNSKLDEGGVWDSCSPFLS